MQVKACGICGSDLHFAKHGATMLALGGRCGACRRLGARPAELDLARDVFMGHEFAAEVLEVGPDTGRLAAGHARDVDPDPADDDRGAPIVYSNDIPGGYGERMLLSAPLLLEVPNGLDARHAALTEPMAVGLHAVNRRASSRATAPSCSAAARSASR